MIQYREVKAWEKAHQIALHVYEATAKFPKEERYSLTDQIRRACVSIPSNISEGCGRNTDPQLMRFFEISKGSASELDYQLFLAKELGYLPADDYDQLTTAITEVQKMLAVFIKKVRQRTVP
jgi:four helix bundle protein